MIINNKWTNEEINILKENYGRIKSNEVQKLLPNRSISSCNWKARTLGLKNDRSVYLQRFSCISTYFDSPNLENSYWAGWLAADGWIRTRDMSVNLRCTDEDAILAYKAAINYSGTVKYQIRKNRKQTYGIHIYGQCGRKLSESLKNIWNIIPNKSLILEPPKLEDEELIKAFIVGLFDGDGCYLKRFRKDRNKFYYYFIFTGTEKMLLWIKKYFDKWVPSNPKRKIASLCKQPGCYSLQYSGSRAIKLMKLLLKVSIPFRLSRKWQEIANLDE